MLCDLNYKLTGVSLFEEKGNIYLYFIFYILKDIVYISNGKISYTKSFTALPRKSCFFKKKK